LLSKMATFIGTKKDSQISKYKQIKKKKTIKIAKKENPQSPNK